MNMYRFRADLHCHTTASDGSLSPEELLLLAKEEGLAGLSITDHDTVEAYGVAIPLAKELGLELLPGIELSSMHQGQSVHILGYGFDLESETLRAFCNWHIERRIGRNREILALLSQKGMPVSEEEMHGVEIPNKRIYGRPHIAQAMIAKGYVASIREAFDKWIGEGKPCYAPGMRVSVEETIATLHKAHGKAVIAHPHLIRSAKLVDELLEMPFDGIEGYYARLPLDVEKKWVDIGNKKGWIVTGGSDFHGSSKPYITLGSSWVAEPVFRQLAS